MTIKSALRSAGIGLGLLTLWFGSMAVLMLTIDVSNKALVLGKPSSILSNMDSDTKLLRSGQNKLVVTSSRSGYVRQLYSAGAWLVLPSLASGCLAISKDRFQTKS